MSGILRRHGWALLAVVVLVGTVTATILLTLSPRYSAKASVWLDHRLDNDVAAAGGSAAQASVAARRNTEVRFLTSPDIAARVVDKLGLGSVRGIGQSDRLPAFSNREARQRAIAAVVDGTTVKATGASYAVVVGYAAGDPVVATAIANQLVDQYVSFRREAEQRDAAMVRLRSEVAGARDEMIRTAAAASAFEAAMKSLARDEESRRLRNAFAGSRDGLQTGEGRNDPATIELATGRKLAELQGLRTQLAQLARARSGTGERGRAAVVDEAGSGARATELRGRIADVRRQIAGLALPMAEEQLAREEDARRRQNEARKRELDAASQAATRQHARLEADLRRLVDARPSSAGAYVIARATVPRTRDFPQPWVIYSGGLLIALAAIAATIILRERLYSDARARRSAERRLSLPVIGTVPDTAAILAPRDVWINPVDLIVAENTSGFRTAFRTILLGLGTGRGEGSPRSIMVSSAVAEEGKTTVAIGLARSAALAGMRVLFIDCDVRLPAASRLLTRDHTFGLADVLEGTVDLKDALCRDKPSGAWILATGKEGSTPNGLVGSDAMMDLIRQASGSYDLVVLDAAPALALAETATLASFADMTLMIARWRTTPVRATRLAIATLRDAGAKVDALVLTRVGR